MDTSTLAILTTIGVPALVAAVAYAIRALADSRTKTADAELVRANAQKTAAEAKKLEAETTGKFLVGAEADAAQVRSMVGDLRGRLDRCEKRHEDCEKRVAAVEEKCDREHAVKDAQIKALFRETGELRASIESGGGR